MGKFTPVPGLQLTDDDLHALGAVVAQWAIAEKQIIIHVFNLTHLTTNPSYRRMKLRGEFSRLQPQWKDLLKDICSDEPDYLDVGTKLAGAAKVLKEDRDAACHWPASRDPSDPNAPSKFVNISVAKFPPFEAKYFAPDQLYELATRIYQLGSDVNFFGFALMCDLFPSLCTWHGPKPESPILQTRQFPTIQKPLHPRPTSRA